VRIRLTLLPTQKQTIIPINYNYFLTSLIYRFLHTSSKDYSNFLHDEGYRLGDGKKGFKLFTFSMLQTEKAEIDGDFIIMKSGHVTWQISSPIEDFLQHLVTGLFSEGNRIMIGPEEMPMSFIIERVETLKNPHFTGSMRFTCLSPVTVSRVDVLNPKRSVYSSAYSKDLRCHYIRPWEKGFSEAIKNNLIKKYRLIHGHDIETQVEAQDLSITIDTEYMNSRNGKIMKKINFKGTDIIGFLAPFEITASPEIIETGYEAGFGEKGSMGFGMVREVNW
jgi:CRISPR-associated endoribonuclease Cas6